MRVYVRPLWAPVFVLVSLFSCFSGHAQIDGVSYEWEEKKDKDGIKIYTSKVPDSPHKAVRGEMPMTGTVAELVALVNDLPRCPDWADLCKHSVAIEEVSGTEQVVHIHNDIPFPVKDRDVVARMRWSRNAESGRVTMHSEATPEPESHRYVPKQKKAVRIYDAVTQWHFTPQESGQVLVENFAHIDPNGPTPAWLTNMLLVNSPLKTMAAMRDIVESGDYRGAKLDF